MAFHNSFLIRHQYTFFNEANCKTSGGKVLASSESKILTESLNGSDKNVETFMSCNFSEPIPFKNKHISLRKWFLCPVLQRHKLSVVFYCQPPDGAM